MVLCYYIRNQKAKLIVTVLGLILPIMMCKKSSSYKLLILKDERVYSVK